MKDFDEAVEIALRTWYPKDHPLHFNPHHPLGKLLGEWGELLDDYMKSLYKPGYEFDPIDELGDIWYYIRILCYLAKYRPALGDIDHPINTGQLFAVVIQELSIAFFAVCSNQDYIDYCDTLNIIYSALFLIATQHDITIQQLTDSNWQKLKPGSERGEQWARARVETSYIGGKVELKR